MRGAAAWQPAERFLFELCCKILFEEALQRAAAVCDERGGGEGEGEGEGEAAVRWVHVGVRPEELAGAKVLTVPAAFSYVTGAAHWESLLRARAIETGCFVLAPAQTGTHSASVGNTRKTHGHSLAVSPWGEVLLDAGTEPGIHIFDMDDKSVELARQKVPSLQHIRAFDGP